MMNIMEMSQKIEALEQQVAKLAQVVTDLLHNRILQSNSEMAEPRFKLPARKVAAKRKAR